jgi:multidrug resistance efflux pump
MKTHPTIPPFLLLAVAPLISCSPTQEWLTGIVATDDVVVGAQIAGRLTKLSVREGDSVKQGQSLAEIEPTEAEADRNYYVKAEQVLSSQIDESSAALRYQEQDTAMRIRQAAANMAATEQDQEQAQAQLDDAKRTYERQERLLQTGATTEQERDHAKTAFQSAQAHAQALSRRVDAERAALQLARASAEQAKLRKAALQTTRRQEAAAQAQRNKADVRLSYSHIDAPIDGIVDVRAARLGEFVAVGQAVVALVNPDDYWVRADVEEGRISGIRLGDTLRVRLASGEERDGVVFYRGADAGFATARDVSRTKRDVRTFEVRLRLDNKDRRLALGSTASVRLGTSR